MTRFRSVVLFALGGMLLVFGAACVQATAEPPSAEPRSISVSGAGEILAEPDIATVNTGVEVQATTVAEARAGAAETAAAVIAALRAGGVEERDIRTTHFSIRAAYDYRGETTRLVGYVVSNTVEVTVRNLAGIGELIDAVAAAGGDAVRFDGISFAHETAAALIQQARKLAVEDARAKAGEIADLTGVTLGSVLTVHETGRAVPRAGAAEQMDMAADMPTTSIQPGTSGVTVTVQAVWAIEEATDGEE